MLSLDTKHWLITISVARVDTGTYIMHEEECSESTDHCGCRHVSLTACIANRRLTKPFQAKLATPPCEYVKRHKDFNIAYDPLPTVKATDPAERK